MYPKKNIFHGKMELFKVALYQGIDSEAGEP